MSSKITAIKSLPETRKVLFEKFSEKDFFYEYFYNLFNEAEIVELNDYSDTTIYIKNGLFIFDVTNYEGKNMSCWTRNEILSDVGLLERDIYNYDNENLNDVINKLIGRKPDCINSINTTFIADYEKEYETLNKKQHKE